MAKRGQLWLTPQPTLRRPGPRWISRRTWRLWRKPKRGGGVPGNGLNASARYRADSLDSPTYSSPLAQRNQSVFPWSLHPTFSHHCIIIIIMSPLRAEEVLIRIHLKTYRGVSTADILTEDEPSLHLYYFKRYYHVLVFLVGWNGVKGLYGITTVLDWKTELCCMIINTTQITVTPDDHDHYLCILLDPFLLLLLVVLISQTAKGFIPHPTPHAVIICLPLYYKWPLSNSLIIQSGLPPHNPPGWAPS